jgi:hypothetical protein
MDLMHSRGFIRQHLLQRQTTGGPLVPHDWLLRWGALVGGIIVVLKVVLG